MTIYTENPKESTHTMWELGSLTGIWLQKSKYKINCISKSQQTEYNLKLISHKAKISKVSLTKDKIVKEKL